MNISNKIKVILGEWGGGGQGEGGGEGEEGEEIKKTISCITVFFSDFSLRHVFTLYMYMPQKREF